MNIDIQLDSVKRCRRSPQEYRYVPRARWKNLEVVGDDWIIRDLCRLIAEQNPDISGLVRVFRGDTPCFNPMPLNVWVKYNPFASETPEQLRKDKT